MATTTTTPANELKPIRSRKWMWRSLAALTAAAIVAFFAPTIIARTPLMDWAVRRGLADLNGTVQISNASLGWFSNIELRGVTIRDKEGHVVAEIGSVRSGKTLLSLLMDTSDFGEWSIDEASVQLIWNAKTSNIEAVFDKYLYGPSKPSDTSAAFSVVGSVKKLTVADADSGRKWTVSPVAVTVASQRDRRQPLKIAAKGPVTEPTGLGALDLEIGIARTTTTTPFGVTTVVDANRGPIAALTPLLRRFQQGIALDGSVTGKVTVKYVEEKQDLVDVSGQVDATDFLLEAPAWLAEPLKLKQLQAPVQLNLAGDQLRVAALNVVCDIGTASAQGVFDLGKSHDAMLRTAGTSLNLNIDLARLVQVLPKTLHFRDDVKLTAGRIEANLVSSAQKEDVVWNGRVTATELQGQHGGQPISWKQPLKLTLAARAVPNRLIQIDSLNCTSDFLSADVVERSSNQFVLTVNCQLSKLRQQLSQFVDVQGWMPEGTATASCTATKSKEDSFKIEGEAKVQQFRLSASANREWKEPEVIVKWAALIEPGKNGVQEAKAGAATLQAGPVWIWASLQEPMALSSSDIKTHFKVRINGDLARWQSISTAWMPAIADWPLSGAGEISGRVRYDAANIEFHDLKAEYQDFRLTKGSVSIAEPKVTLTASGRRDAKTGRIQLLDTALTSSAITVSVPVVALQFDANGNPDITAKGTIRGDVARIERWLTPANEPTSLTGTFNGDISLQPVQNTTTFAVDVTASVTPKANQTSTTSQPSRVGLNVGGTFDRARDSLRLDRMRLDGAGLNFQASGVVDSLSAKPAVHLSGQIDYDWDKLGPYMRSQIGAKTKITGRGTRPFRLNGTLTTPIPLTGEVGLGWDSVQAFGCQVGSVRLDLKFNGSEVQIAPIQTTLNQGRVYVATGVQLEPAPSELRIGKGSGVDRAKITPAMCDELLGYAAPALARATDAEGEVTLRLTGGRVPLAQTDKADVAGQFVLHSVRLSATSPIIRLLTTVLQTPPEVALQKEAVVNVRVTNGRVYHDKLELAFPGLVLRTSGSVGLDGSLDMVVETPIPPRWIGNVPWKDSLAKQTIKIPLRGTLSKPQLDEDAVRRHIAEVTRNTARDTANDTLRKEFEKGLQKLFPPKK